MYFRKRRLFLRQMLCEPSLDLVVLAVACEVYPFVRVVLVVVEFFGAVRETDVAITLIANRVVAMP